jgi:amino acid transporter
VFPVLYLGWKFIKKTKFKSPMEVDLYQDVEEIEEYTRNFVPSPDRHVPYSFLLQGSAANAFCRNAVDKWFNKIFS